MSATAEIPVRLPDPAGLGTAIGALLGSPVVITKAPAPLLFTAANRRGYCALYVTAEGFCSAAVACDLRFAASAGAALAAQSSDVVDTWMRAGRLDDEGAENLGEVLNVVAANFNDANPQRHVKLWGCLQPGQAVPRRTLPLFARGVMRTDLDIEVEQYLKGKIALFSAP